MISKWPVEIFRYSENKGWELYQQSTTSSPNPKTSKTIQKKSSQEIQSNQPSYDTNGDDDEGVTIVPRKGCVEVKKLRLRIHLFQKQSRIVEYSKQDCNTTPKTLKNEAHLKKDAPHTTVIRRRDTMLFSSRRGLGAVVFKFRSVADCMAFADRLVELNADYILNQTDDRDVQRPTKRMKMKKMNPCSDSRNGSDDNNHVNKKSKEQSQHQNKKGQPVLSEETQSNEKKSDEVRSYIVRLLHDGDFLNFVDSVEKSLVSAPDCTRILEALDYTT